MEANTIHPTHTCFDDALDYITERVQLDSSLARRATLLLVHGICRTPEGVLYSHAWCEEGAIAWDAGILNGQKILFSADRDEFLKSRQVQQATRYTIRQAFDENYRSGTYGPWIDAYRQLATPRSTP